MTRRLHSLALVVLAGIFVGITGCQIIDGGAKVDDGYGERIWVAQDFTGGQQCNPDATYDPPDTEADLEEAGVGILEVVVVGNAVCEACIVCPTYSAVHFAQIRESNLERAQSLGYEQSEAPSRDGQSG